MAGKLGLSLRSRHRRAPRAQGHGEIIMAAEDRTGPEEAARRADLEAGFQFVLTHDAELLQRLEDA
jgi:hypothetical protein